MFLRNKSIIFLYKTIAAGQNISPLYIILLSPVKKILFESGEKYAFNRGPIISLKEALSWNMDQKQQYEVKNGLMMDLFLSAVWTLILTAPIHCGGSFGK